MYLTYQKFKEYGGALDRAAFDNFAFEAQSIIDYWTFNRLQKDTEYPEAVQRLMFKLIQTAVTKSKAQNLGNNLDGTGNAAISSQSNDGVSVSFNVMSASELFANCKSETAQLVKQYLYGVKNSLGQRLLYRGVY